MLRTEDFFEATVSLLDGKSAVQVLTEAYDLISDRNRWSTLHYALNCRGERVHPGDPTAVRWSMMGAVARCCNRWAILPPYFYLLMNRLIEARGIEDGASSYDQYCGHEGVLALLREAIVLVSTGMEITNDARK